MKLKFSKTLAIACILCMTFATLTAFAAEIVENDVTVVTSYDVDNLATTDITVKATVGGVAVDDEITYYVSKVEEGVEKIVYIDQATAQGTSVEFTFNASQGDVLASTAKNGSDAGYKFPTFNFAEGVNFQTKGSATNTKTDANWAVDVNDASLELEEGTEALTGYVYQGQISGKVAEYGVQVVIDDVTYEFPAKGCDANGVYVVVIDGLDAAVAAAATPYVR